MTQEESVLQRLNCMAGLIREARVGPRVREVASTLFSGTSAGAWQVKENDQRAELARVYDYVRQTVRFTGDPFGTDAIYGPGQTINKGIGDCDDQAVLVGSLVQAVGFPVKLRAVSYDGVNFSHVYALAGIKAGGGRWVPVDTVYAKGLGVEAPHAKRLEVLV